MAYCAAANKKVKIIVILYQIILCINNPEEEIFEKEGNPGNQHFLLYSQCFPPIQLFTTQYPLLMTLKNKPFENIVGKGENAAFSPFPAMFSTHSKKKFCFKFTFILLSANALNLD